MTFYTNMAATATRLLAKYGQTITWSQTTGGTYNPATGETTGGTTTNYSGYGALLDFNTSLIDGDQIQATDKRLLLQSGDIAAIQDQLTVDGTAYTVVMKKEINPAGTVVMYEFQLRS